MGFGRRGEPTGRERPQRCRLLAHGEALLGVVDRRREQRGERQLGESLVQCHPAANCTGHGHGHRATLRHRVVPLRLHVFDGEPRGRPAARVEAVELSGLGLPHERESVTADAIAGGLHQADRGVGGDDGVHGIAAALHDLHAGLRGKWMTGRDDTVTRPDHRTAWHGKRCAGLRPYHRPRNRYWAGGLGLESHGNEEQCDEDEAHGRPPRRSADRKQIAILEATRCALPVVLGNAP
jgi:hypothetical protein